MMTGTPTQFGGAMEELGIQLIFASRPRPRGGWSGRREPSKTSWERNSGWPGRPLWKRPRQCIRKSSLGTLRLDNNQIYEMESDVFENLTVLTSLRLNNNSLTQVSDGIFDNLSSLEELSLEGNEVG